MKYHLMLQQAAKEGSRLHIITQDGENVIGFAEQYLNGYIKLRLRDGLIYISHNEIVKLFKTK